MPQAVDGIASDRRATQRTVARLGTPRCRTGRTPGEANYPPGRNWRALRYRTTSASRHLARISPGGECPAGRCRYSAKRFWESLAPTCCVRSPNRALSRNCPCCWLPSCTRRCGWFGRSELTTANRFASATYGVTSALILSPLLWESTVRFQVLSPAFTAVVLVAFVVLALALAWRRNLQVIPWVATLAAVITALALIIATHELVPLTAALLAVALATEVCRLPGTPAQPARRARNCRRFRRVVAR